MPSRPVLRLSLVVLHGAALAAVGVIALAAAARAAAANLASLRGPDGCRFLGGSERCRGPGGGGSGKLLLRSEWSVGRAAP